MKHPVFKGWPWEKMGLMDDDATGVLSIPRKRFKHLQGVASLIDPEAKASHLTFQVALRDVPCREEYARFRPFAYMRTDIFLVCFAIDDRGSLDRVREVWVPEISSNSPQTPWILVGMKTDLRTTLDGGKKCSGGAKKFISTKVR